MNADLPPDTLQTLLRRADLAAPARPLDPLALRFRARRRRTRTSAALAALLCALAAIPFLHHAPPPSAPAPAPVAIHSVNPSIAGELQSRIATETALRLAQRRATGEFLARDPAFARDAAAQTLVLAADRRRATDPQGATRAYAAAATLFPSTPWGRRAADALSQPQ